MQSHRRRMHVAAAVVMFASLLLTSLSTAAAEPPANEFFDRTWRRTDQPVASLQVSRTWMWGEAFTGAIQEPYAEADGEMRTVQYYDKSRMEISHDPNADPNSIWYVTNGLLAKELITGQMQVGVANHEDRAPADINVAGDLDDAAGPTYATFSTLLNEPAYASGQTITNRVARSGVVLDDPSLAQYNVTAARHVEVPNISHQVASPFWTFMNSQGLVYENGQTTTANLFVDPFYATGYPITEAYWANVKVAGGQRDVLMQCFERRCLTYAPTNDPGWQVEAGNVGQHYHAWRYEQWEGDPPAIGAVLHEIESTVWSEFDIDGVATGILVGDEYQLTAALQYGVAYNYTSDEEIPGGLTDFHVSLETRSMSPDDFGYGCLVAPALAHEGGLTLYEFCIDSLGDFSASVEQYDAEGTWLGIEPFLEYRGSIEAHPWDEWNTLGVTVQGQHLWFYVNGDLIGHAELDAAVISQVGFYVYNSDERVPHAPVTFAFRNVTVYELE
ncbi:MAG: hypothetical protein M3439_03515 [Chloroflexota bacterium]|nr:hypothetical protein [Chloroflexota bacterium]